MMGLYVSVDLSRACSQFSRDRKRERLRTRRRKNCKRGNARRKVRAVVRERTTSSVGRKKRTGSRVRG